MPRRWVVCRGACAIKTPQAGDAMRIESIRLRNFKAFREVHLTGIPPFMVVVGANGTGKTTLFDVFGFLHDCLQSNVRQALSARGRFREVLSRGASSEDTILIEIQYRMDIVGKSRLVTYTLEVAEAAGAPFIKSESLRYKRGRHGAPYYFLNFQNGQGWAIRNEEDFSRPDEELSR